MCVCVRDACELGCAVYPICSYVGQEPDVFLIHSQVTFSDRLSLNLALAFVASEVRICLSVPE